MPYKELTTTLLEDGSGDPDYVLFCTPDHQLLVFGMEKCRLCGFYNVPHKCVALFDTGPFYPACSILDEDPIRPTRDVNKYVPGYTKYVQGRTTTQKLRVRYPISLVTLIYFPMADRQGNDLGVERS